MKLEQIEARASKALEFLTETDTVAADLKLEAERLEAKYESTVDAYFLTAEGAVEQRKAFARQQADPIYLQFLAAQREYDAMSNKRKTEALAMDWLKSLYAHYRQGK